jgi:hypothetical protein
MEAVWKVTIPPNTKGILPLPSEDVSRWSLETEPLEGNSKIKQIGKHEAEEEFEVPSGSYSFKVKTAKP